MACASPHIAAWMQALGLPQAWCGQRAWRVLDAGFGHGERLVQLWHAWQQDQHACHMLHVVAFAQHAPELARVRAALAADPAASPLARELESQWFGLLPGFNRFVLHGGRLQLTLCIGPTLALLRQQHFYADSVVIGPASGHEAANAPATDSDDWDGWAVKALARVCRRGSTLAVLPGSALDLHALSATGWVASGQGVADTPATGVLGACYQPSWQIRTTRTRWPQAPSTVSHCVVVGAGLAGAAVAGALALRGWQVTVLDAAPQPAAGASGLPVGLFAPQLSRDDGPRSRLSRAGIRATLQVARRLLHHGQDWALSGVAHVDNAGHPTDALPRDWPPHGQPWAAAATAASLDGAELAKLARPQQALWHAMAGWIKPQQLVRAWLQQPGVCFQGSSPVQAIVQGGNMWRLFGPHGRLLAEAPHLVIACAGGSPALLLQALSAARQPLPASPVPMTPIDGQVSWAMHTARDAARFPPFPVNGSGSVAAHVPWHGATAWFAGATYEPQGDPAWSELQGHEQNLARLAQLLPDAAALVSPALVVTGPHAWRGTRWTLPDRLPVAGTWPMPSAPPLPGLWLSTAMGSRGLTHAALCGELIAAQMGAEPLPLDTNLHRYIDTARLATRPKARSAAPTR